MAAKSLTRRGSGGTTGKLPELSRRGAIGAALGVGVAATASALLPGVASGVADPDALFWKRYRHWKRLSDRWEAIEGQSDAQMNRWGDRIRQIEAELMAMRPRSVAVVWAKWRICEGEVIDYTAGRREFTSHQVIGRDLQRLAAKNLRPEWAI